MIISYQAFVNPLTMWPCDSEIVLARGCFDVVHVGHLRHLQAAKALGTFLCVAVTPDRYVSKGPGRPAFSQDLRAEMVNGLGCVDFVTIDEHETAVETIHLLRPAVYVKGGEYRDRMTTALEAEKAAVESVGGRLVFTKTEKWSSTELLASQRRFAEFSGVTVP